MEFLCDLILLKGIYFDFYLYLVWTVCNGLFLFIKLDYLKIPILLVVMAYLLMIFTFSSKLYLAKRRNFTSDMSKLTRFFLLTVLIQMPLVSFFLISSPTLLCTPLEVSLHVFLFLTILIESTVSFFAVYKAVKNVANQSPAYFPAVGIQSGSRGCEPKVLLSDRIFQGQFHRNTQTDSRSTVT